MQEPGLIQIQQIVQFVLEIDKLKGVLRKVKPVGEDRYENTAEHSWQIAVFALSLARTLELSVDPERVVAMLLVHDIGEIDAGDKFVFAQDGWEERKAAELRAVERIFSFAPETLAGFLLDMWKEFDAGETQNARFAKAIDRSMPVLLNLSNGGGSWLENRVTYERVCARVGPEIEAGCPELWKYVERQLERARQKGFFAETQG
ncbi:HD domain-containing protein [Acidipila rosea]|uniref:5'-deoxynucleotidase n=1 Tax=Acidipila rosea TaxID=768535 RepID=A0A4R1KWV2_9BACT|nr:HD domain-containing protein [Acidipila rosea]TCK69758.1 putative hydrolase of HD superfamily [Acidipila rosea]